MGTLHSVRRIPKLPSTVIPRHDFLFLLPTHIKFLGYNYTLKLCGNEFTQFCTDHFTSRP